MSNYKVLSFVSRTLRTILWSAYETDNEIRSIVNSSEAITFSSPSDASRDANNRLSIWLYHVTENEYVSNQPQIRGQDSHRQPPPLALDLHYLITPLASTNDGSDANLLLLGKTMQVINDAGVLFLEEETLGVHE